MSLTITLNSNKSVLSADFLQPLNLNNKLYECALIYLKTYNSIPNVDKSNNLFHYGANVIEIPEGIYEINDIIKYLEVKMDEIGEKDLYNLIDMEANVNTSKCLIYSPKYDVYFNKANSIGSLFGFTPRVLKGGQIHHSDKTIDILITNTIRVECNIVEGSFINNIPSHVIHEFSPSVPPGYQLIESPTNVIYLPVKNNNIQNIEVRVVNERGRLVNFRGENISLRLHIRPLREY